MIAILTLLIMGLLAGCIIAVIIAPPAHAALPPQSKNALRSNAVFIITGTVQQITHQEVERDGGSDHHYHAIVKVETVEKAKITPDMAAAMSLPMPTKLPEPNTQIDVYYWQSSQRKAGWVGPTGQTKRPMPETWVRLFLTVKDGQLALLEPTGWEPVT